MIRKYHNHKPQTNPWHREEEPLNHHETPGRQIKLKTGQKLLLVIIDGCLATRQNGLICHTWYNKTITMATRISIYTCMLLWHYLDDILMYLYMDLLKFLPIPKCIKTIILYFKKNQNKG